MPVMLYQGDCLDVLRTLSDNSIHSVVTDPPYGLSFMDKHWDYDVPTVEIWTETLRVLKPGGHLLSFSGTRTYHRMVVAIEDAGFDVRDQIGWLYGSGFPKSHNLDGEWLGWGTALKPAWEPICVARKPFGGTVAANVLQHECGAINIDACRIGSTTRTNSSVSRAEQTGFVKGFVGGTETVQHDHGRWPANIIHDGSDEVLDAFAAFGVKGSNSTDRGQGVNGGMFGALPTGTSHDTRAAGGSASRFFYCAKASKSDRQGSKHPTVKPVALMRYLVRLVTPIGGTVLDPFAGSGTTGQAAIEEGMNAVLIEREPEYCDDIRHRLAFFLDQGSA